MSDTQYLAQEITVTRQFLMRMYVHPLLAPMPGITIEDEFYQEMWRNQPEMQTYNFGGLHGQQFSTIEQLVSFNEALSVVLAKHKIDPNHKDEFLYLTRFYGSDGEHQSFNNNLHNRLIEYTRFILDVSKNSEKHIQRLVKNKAYRVVEDPYTREYFFAKHTLFDKYTLEEIIEYRPKPEPGDIVSYMRFNIGLTELYVPYDLSFNLIANHPLKNFYGESVQQFDVPRYVQRELFKHTFEYMVDEHRIANSPFYRLINKAPLISDDYKKLYKQYKKNRFSETDSLTKFGIILTHYLSSTGIMKVKRRSAAFLFDYFSLLKIFPLKPKISVPENYLELPNFFNKQGHTSETIRLMLK